MAHRADIAAGGQGGEKSREWRQW